MAAALATFVLLRDGAPAELDQLVQSRHCLERAIPKWIGFDDIAFHSHTFEAPQQLRLQV